MNQKIKTIIKKVVPEHLIRTIKVSSYQFQCRKVKRLFEQAAIEPTWLDFNMLDLYQRKYSSPPQYGYDPKSIAKRGEKRAINILKLIPSKNAYIFLEIGCWDGMVSYGLQCRGKKTVAIDNQTVGFDERAIRGGVKLIQMDGRQLQFDDETFDVVFSYNTFEHLEKPEDVLQDSIRVVKTGGYIYHEFGPTYLAPWGAHLYRQITIPYCHILFPDYLLQSYANANSLGVLDFNLVNRYTAEDFRNIWKNSSRRLKRIRYYEIPDTSYIDLIEKHPSCFKSKTSVFNNLIIGQMSVLFQKKE